MSSTLKATVYLRPIRLSDAKTIFEAIQASRMSLRRWLPWVGSVRTFRDEQEFIRKNILARRKGRAHVFCILHRKTRRFLGLIDLQGIGQEIGRANIGYWIRTDEQNKGYATEACKRMLGFAFRKLELPAVQILVQPENKASARIPRKLQFKLEGQLRHNAVLNGCQIDHLSFSLLPSEWKPVNPK